VVTLGKVSPLGNPFRNLAYKLATGLQNFEERQSLEFGGQQKE
jgi:hypothetical protein